MKKYFYLMSLMLGLMVGSFGLVACGDDDDKGSSSGGGDDTPSTEVDTDKMIGTWYGIDENSDSKVCVFCINFMENGVGVYAEYKAKAKSNWKPEAEAAHMSWELSGVTVKFLVTTPDKGTQERKADILRQSDNEMTIKRYLEEGTDVMTITRARNDQEVAMVFAKLIENKSVPNSDEVTAEDLIGTWTTNSTNNSYMAVFTENMVTIIDNGEETFRGEYSLNDGMITIPLQQGVETRSVPGLLYDKSVMVLKNIYKTESSNEEMLGYVLLSKARP
jgi:hypothetical protein